jgi:hypothetical protein
MTLETGERGRGDGAGVGGRIKGEVPKLKLNVHVHMSSSNKRQFTPSSSPSPARTPKAPRISTSLPARPPFLCVLPPTCHLPNRYTPLNDSRALESHYATHHAHVCSSSDCGCVFPDARLLELVRHISFYLISLTILTRCHLQHLTECHDPLAAIRKDRGEKIVRLFFFPFRSTLFPETPPG